MATPADVTLTLAIRRIDRQISDYVSIRDRATAGLAATGIVSGLVASRVHDLTTAAATAAVVVGALVVIASIFILRPRTLLGEVDPDANLLWAKGAPANDYEGSRLALVSAEALNDCYKANLNLVLWQRRYLAALLILFVLDIVLWIIALIV
jgi:hypothetical protein